MTSSRVFMVLAGLLLILLGGCGAGGGVYHRVGDGQTLYRISRTYGVDENYLARINGISDPTHLRTGDKIFIPGATSTLSVVSPSRKAPPPPPMPAAPPVAKAPPVKPAKALPPTPAPATKPNVAPAPSPPPRKEVASTTVATTAAKPPTTSGRFLWPLRGPLLRRFGSSKDGTSGKGLEIGAPINTPVVAAAAGRVIYSGDGISTYGNLIIVKHDDSFFTVYGFNARNLVPSGTFVSKGEKIALAGNPPGGGKPRLYFEIRYGKEAVDPTIYLP